MRNVTQRRSVSTHVLDSLINGRVREDAIVERRLAALAAFTAPQIADEKVHGDVVAVAVRMDFVPLLLRKGDSRRRVDGGGMPDDDNEESRCIVEEFHRSLAVAFVLNT